MENNSLRDFRIYVGSIRKVIGYSREVGLGLRVPGFRGSGFRFCTCCQPYSLLPIPQCETLPKTLPEVLVVICGERSNGSL